jgi:mRNA interferase HigB
MHVIARKPLDEFIRRHPQAKSSLNTWWDVAETADWKTLEQVKKSWGSADYVQGFTVFNISGNKYRLITRIDYERKRVYIREVLTHAEYSRGRWNRR